jgi:hypothetical protein
VYCIPVITSLPAWTEVLELPKRLPRGFFSSHAVPLDKDVPDITVKLGAQDSCWSRQETTILCRRHRPWNSRRIATVRLQQPHVEDVV